MTPAPAGDPQPPSLAEVMAIVRRRRRNRRRVGRGAALATIVVGAGFGLDALQGDGEARMTEPLVPASEPAAATTTTTASPLTLPGLDDPSPGGDTGSGCPGPDPAAAATALFDSGREAFASGARISYDDAMAIAEEWQVSIDDAKALAGLSLGSGVTFDASLLDDAIAELESSSHSSGDLEAVADEWGTSLTVVKVLAHLDTPEIAAVLDPCL